MSEKLLDKPARVHHTVFAAGLPERMVIECAQRHYEWSQQPKPDVDLEAFREILDTRSKQRPVGPYVHAAPKNKGLTERLLEMFKPGSHGKRRSEHREPGDE